MTAAQTIMLKLSSARQRLNELLQVETRSAEEQTEMETLTKEVSATEPELRAALAAEPNPEEVVTQTGDPETRERLELRGKTGLADFLSAAAGGREVSGAAAEVRGLGRLCAAEQASPGHFQGCSTRDASDHGRTGHFRSHG